MHHLLFMENTLFMKVRSSFAPFGNLSLVSKASLIKIPRAYDVNNCWLHTKRIVPVVTEQWLPNLILPCRRPGSAAGSFFLLPFKSSCLLAISQVPHTVFKKEFIIIIPKHTPPPTFLSLLIALSRPKSETQGFPFPFSTICHDGL